MTDHQRIDTLRRKYCGVEVTPNLNNLIENGAFFEKAYNTYPLCVPARTALATGINPIKNGMVHNDLPGVYAREENITLHEMLSDAGYEIAHVGVHHIVTKPNIKEKLPFERMITDKDFADYAKGQDMDIARKERHVHVIKEKFDGVYENHAYSNHVVDDWQYELENFKDYWFTTQAIDYIENAHKDPFALFLCMWAPHPPLLVPKHYADMFDYKTIEMPENVAKITENEPPMRRDGTAARLAEGIDDTEWRKMWAAHMALVKMADDQIGRVVKALKDSGQWDNTILVFTADHGEQLGEHNMYQKMEMYEGSVRVPALFCGADIKASNYKKQISHLNFVPTILDLLNIEKKQDFEAQSLARTLVSGADYEEEAVFGCYCGNRGPGSIRRMIVDKGYKLVYDTSEHTELFNLEEDPMELHNLAADGKYKDIKKQLYNALCTWAKDSGDNVDYLNFDELDK